MECRAPTAKMVGHYILQQGWTEQTRPGQTDEGDHYRGMKHYEEHNF
jgi:hypothetical protein